ncbi:MAG: cache domain-containing protein [Candidatus Korobacteraceae bacterium]
MKWNSIRTKVLAALLACLIIGVGGILAMMHYGFERNSQALAAESVMSAQRLFTILQAREISKMTAVSETLVANPQIRDALASHDRARLLELTAPLYTQLKAQGITNWMFHTPEPDMRVLLRLHNPAKFGDQLHRFMDKEAVRTHAIVVGNELAKAGFALRILRPVYGDNGTLIGYVEFGEEFGQFIHAMQQQTGNDYGLLLGKNSLNREMWAESSAVWKRRDNWNDNPSFVVADRTTGSDAIIRFQGDVSAIQAQGQVLERYKEANSVFVRGIFPIRDASGKTVGAMFVVRDISEFYLAMQHTQNVLVLMTVAALTLGMLSVLMLLNRLVFRRLKDIIRVATRVVGGDYESEIRVSSHDEVGEFELLFEQFRSVFVTLLTGVSGLQVSPSDSDSDSDSEDAVEHKSLSCV